MKTLNVNEAPQEELEKLPGVGRATAEKIIKARPIADLAALEELIPPSAWLKIEEAGATFAFGDDAETVKQGPEEPRGDAQTAQPIVVAEPVVKMYNPDPVTLRRLMPGQELREGEEYFCLWNMRHGPHGEAWVPEDQPVQVEVETWFKAHNMVIKFAHYGPSVRVGTPNRGLVNLVLFEVIKEEKDDTPRALAEKVQSAPAAD